MSKQLKNPVRQQAFLKLREPYGQECTLVSQKEPTAYMEKPARPGVRTVARIVTSVLALEHAIVALPAYAQSAPANLPTAPNTSAPAGQRPIMDAANNGVPIALIAPPSAGGVSRNQYEQFNVNPNGLILNNSSGNVQTQLGGWIAGNPQLGVTPARIILNEVVSGNPSHLRGTIEVAGHRADIVVANPNGITCNGCGFLNTDRASLSTGAPRFGVDGSLAGFDVRKGQLTVRGLGLNAANIEQLDLIARGLVIEGEIWAKNLNVIAGANQVLYGAVQAAAQGGNGVVPGFAIDIKDVGGMYANQIYLVATELGLGVNSTGRMAALQGNLTLLVNGDLTLQDTYAKQNIRMESAGSTRLAGQTKSDGASSLNAAGKLSNPGTIDAGEGLIVNAAAVDNSGIMAQRGAQGAVLTVSTDLVNTGAVYSAGRLGVHAAAVDNADGEIAAAGTVSIASATAINNTHGKIIGDGNLHVAATSFNNSFGMVGAKEAAAVRLGSGLLDNTQGELIGTQALTLGAGEIRNGAGTIASGSALSLDTQGAALINNNGGRIVANGDLIISSQRFDNAAGTAASVNGNLQVTTNGRQFINEEGKLQAARNATIHAGNSSNRKGLISGQDVIVTAGTLSNSIGQIAAGGTLAISTQALSNGGGSLQSVGDAQINTGDQELINTGSGTTGGIVAGGALTVVAGSLNNQAGFIASNANQTLSIAGDLDNRAAISGGSGGKIVSNGDVSIAAANVLNQNGRINTIGAATVTAGLVDNRSGSILANGNTQFNVTNLDNRAQGGTAGVIDAANITVASNTITNQGGALHATNDVTLSASALDNTDGVITAGNNLMLASSAMTNANGRMVGDQAVTIATSSRTLGGTIASTNNVTLNINGNYSNTGLLSAQKNLTVNATNLDNSGTLKAGETMTANTADLVNSGEISGKSVLLNASGTLVNTASGLIDGVDTQVNADIVHNTGRIYGDRLGINANTVNNSGTGALAARDRLLIGARALNNTNGGLIYSLGDAGIGGGLDANRQLQGSMQSLVNASSRIEAAGTLSIASVNILNRNDGLTTTRVIDTSTYREEVQANGIGTKYPLPLCSGIGGGQDANGCIVHPDKYGLRSAVTPVYTHTTTSVPDAEFYREVIETQVNYVWNSPIFSQFQVAPVAAPPPPEPAGSCSYVDPLFGMGGPVNSPACNQWRTEFAIWNTAFQTTLVQLDTKINAYNAEVNEDNRIHWFEDYLWYKLTATPSRTVVATTAPAQILSGDGMNIAASLTNRDSQVVAGSALSIAGPAVTNIATQGEQRTDFSGTAQFTEVVSCGSFGRRHCRNWYGVNPYNPAPISTMVDLPTIRYESFAGNQTIARSLAAAAGNVDASIADTVMPASGNSRRVAGQAVQATMADNGQFALTVPTNRLFSIHAQPAARYLVEIDPRFTNQRRFLSSDYFLQILNRDPERQMKRYGDGFTEQALVNDQILALTGRRYLIDYSNTEDEFMALMDAGVAYVKEYQLSPGVALSAEQMARLTTDIVLLVTQTVALPDGTGQQVLVPRVYLRRPTGQDLQSTGSLIAASDVLIKTDHDLVNSGAISGNTVTALAGNDLVNQGGRVSGQDMMIRANNDLKNLSGVIAGVGQNSNVSLLAGRDVVLQTLAGQTSNSDGSSTRASVLRIATIEGGNISLNAGRNLTAQGSLVDAQQDLVATAARDMLVTTVAGQYQLDVKDASGRATERRTAYIAEAATRNQSSLLKAGRDIALIAGSDVTLRGAHVGAGTDGAGNLLLQGQNVSIEAVKDRTANDVQNIGVKSYTRIARDNETLMAGSVTADGNLTVRAIGAASNGSGNIVVTGANISTQYGQVTLAANNDIEIRNDITRHKAIDESYVKSGNVLATVTTTKSSSKFLNKAEGSSISGNTIVANAGRDLTVQGSAVVGDGDMTLSAINKVSVLAATSTSTEKSSTKVQENGFLSGGGFGISYGQRITTVEQDRDGTVQSGQERSLVGTSQGDLNVTAGAALKISGSDLAAGSDMSLAGQDVTIDPGRDDTQGKIATKMEQDALTLEVGGSVVNAIQTMSTMVDAAGKTKNSRVKALAAATAAMAAANAAKEIAANGVNVSISLTAGHSESEQIQTTANSDSSGSTIAAGRNLNISASGAGNDSDVNVIGSDLLAGNDVTLIADHQINLKAAQDTEEQHSKSKSMSAAAGVAVSVGTSGMAFGFNASASMGRAKEDGEGITQRNSHVKAGNIVSLESGGDTNIQGAVVSGEQVNADIGGDLNVESLQDTAWFDSKSQNASVNATVGFGASVSASYNHSKIKSDYASVQEQSGILAGDGGFDINVKGNTDLKGAVIASSQVAIDDSRNSLTTATLTQSEIQNHSIADADSMGGGVSASFGGSDVKDGGKGKGPGDSNLVNAGNGPNITDGKYEAGKALIGNLLNNGSESRSSSGVTWSAISAGAVTITNEDEQVGRTGTTVVETIASLNRDTTNTNTAVQKQDVQAMKQAAEAEQAVKQEAFKVVTVYTDDAYKTLFKNEVKFYKITCNTSQQECLADPGKVTMVAITQDEAKQDGKVLVVNGILNTADRAAQLAYQNAPLDDQSIKPSSITLMHIEPSNTTLGEILVAGYEKILAPTLGYSIADNTYADTLQGRDDEVTFSLGHSRGVIVQRNAFNIAAENGYENKNLKVEGVGGGVGLQDYMNAAVKITTETGRKNIVYTYMVNDPVPVIAAGNPGDALAAFKEFFNVLSSNNSAHSCYGTGAAGCATIANPVSGGPPPLNQDSASIRVYRGDELVNPRPIISGGQP